MDKEERWNESLGVNYTVDNFGIIDDSDSGNDVACCILPKHAQMPSQPVTQEEHQDTGESNQVGDLYETLYVFKKISMRNLKCKSRIGIL